MSSDARGAPLGGAVAPAGREALVFERRLHALRVGAVLGHVEAPALQAVAREAEDCGLEEVASEARRLACRAQRVQDAAPGSGLAWRKREFRRWANGRANRALPGDFVFVLQEAGEEADGAAVHLRPLPTKGGRLRFRVVAALGVENPPDEYSDVPARGRAWRWRHPPAGKSAGLNEAQAQVASGIVKGKLRSGWSINRANARLATRPARRKSGGRAPTGESGSAKEQRPVAPVSASPQIETAAAPATLSVDGLAEGPAPRAARPRQAGWCTQLAVEDAIAAGEDVVLGLPGIGPASRAAVRERSHAPTWADCAAAGVQEREQAVLVSGEEPSGAEQDERAATMGTAGQGAPVIASLPTSGAVSDAPLVASAVCEGAQPAYQSQPQVPDPTISVEGDGVEGLRLAQWQGAARVGLTPVARGLGLEEVQLLVHEDGEASTLVACWPGGETTVSCPVDGRVGQMRAVRELIQRIRAGA